MKAGVSTASLYPLHIEDAFSCLANLGVSTAEIFANCIAEGGEPYVSMIDAIRREHGMCVPSFHPFSSPMEGVFLFSSYDRRVDEMLEMYERFFEGMDKLGAKIFVLHGAMDNSRCTTERYFERFRLLAERAKAHGITLAQENVHYCKSGSLDFLLEMKKQLGEYAAFVLDLKQARRCGADPLDYAEALGSAIVHCHVSDANCDRDCLPIGEGDFDFPLLIKKLRGFGYDGALIVELYRRDYGEHEVLKSSADRLEELIAEN